jgi:hypothetical protein
MARPSGHEKDPERPDYERSDVPPRTVAQLALGLAVFLLATPCALWVLYPTATHTAGIAPPAAPPPRLQVDPAADLLRLRSDEQKRLTGYGWADPDHHLVRLPIERAIELTAERGLPGWPKP